MWQVDDGADTVGVSRALGRWLPTRRRYLSAVAVVGVAFIGWARPLLPGPVVR